MAAHAPYSRFHNPGTYRVKAPGRSPLSRLGGRSRPSPASQQRARGQDDQIKLLGIEVLPSLKVRQQRKADKILEEFFTQAGQELRAAS